MPANRGLGSPNWNPQPDFQPHTSVQGTVDERVFNIYSEADVAESLRENDPQTEVYRWCLDDEEVDALVLESARIIVENRRTLLLNRQLEFARTKRLSKGEVGKTAIVAGYIQNLETGETTAYSREVPLGRSFG
jgi:hypothetical protein